MSEKSLISKPADYWKDDWAKAPIMQSVVAPKPAVTQNREFWNDDFNLSQHRANGTRAPARVPSEWEKDLPLDKPQSIEEARQLWTPLIPLFVENMSSKFLQALRGVDYPMGRTSLGWIDNAPLWSSFWEVAAPINVKRRNNPALTTVEEKAEEQKLFAEFDRQQDIHRGKTLDAYIKGAACSGNMSFFTTMPPQAMGVVREVLLDTSVLIEPNVLTWLQQNDPKCEPVTKRQSDVLKDLTWLPSGYDRGPSESTHCITWSRGNCSMETSVDLLCRAAQQHNLESADLSRVFGFIMLQMDETIDRKSIIAEIQQSMGRALPADVDLSLIAMCSGYNVGEGKGQQQADIFALGREVSMPLLERLESQRMAGQIMDGSAMAAGLPDTAIQLLSILNALDEVKRPEQLYKAISGYGLNNINSKINSNENEHSVGLGYHS